MNKYRRIEVNAFRRQVTIISGVWSDTNLSQPPAHPGDPLLFEAPDAYDPVEPSSPEGQEILVEAVRSLERRLSPEALAQIRSGTQVITPRDPNRHRIYRWWQSLCEFLTSHHKGTIAH